MIKMEIVLLVHLILLLVPIQQMVSLVKLDIIMLIVQSVVNVHLKLLLVLHKIHSNHVHQLSIQLQLQDLMLVVLLVQLLETL